MAKNWSEIYLQCSKCESFNEVRCNDVKIEHSSHAVYLQAFCEECGDIVFGELDIGDDTNNETNDETNELTG